jgi:Rrp15p
VVKLFNAIQQSQNTVAEAAEEAKASKGSGKPRLPAPTFDDKGKKKGKKRDNVVGRGKESE